MILEKFNTLGGTEQRRVRDADALVSSGHDGGRRCVSLGDLVQAPPLLLLKQPAVQ